MIHWMLAIWQVCLLDLHAIFELHSCGKRIEAHQKFWSPVVYYHPGHAYSFQRSQRQSVGVCIWVHCSFGSQWGWVSVAKWDSGNCMRLVSSFSPGGFRRSSRGTFPQQNPTICSSLPWHWQGVVSSQVRFFRNRSWDKVLFEKPLREVGKQDLEAGGVRALQGCFSGLIPEGSKSCAEVEASGPGSYIHVSPLTPRRANLLGVSRNQRARGGFNSSRIWRGPLF